MSQLDLEAVNPTGPLLGKIRAIAVTTSSARFDLSAAIELSASLDRVLQFEADGGDVYYAFNTADAGSIDQAVTTAGVATQCAVIPQSTFRDIRIPYVRATGGATVGGPAVWLLVKGSAACTLRIYASSESPMNRI